VIVNNAVGNNAVGTGENATLSRRMDWPKAQVSVSHVTNSMFIIRTVGTTT